MKTSKLSLLGILLLVLSVTLTVTACGAESAPDPIAKDDDVRPGDFLIKASDLPEDWRDSNSQGVDYRVTVCGVDIEPEKPLRATSIRFSQGPVGPFLEEHVRVYASDVATGVIGSLKAALPECTEYSAKGNRPDSPTATFKVEPLTVPGAPEDSVSWRQTSQGELPITSDLILIRRGDAAVMFMSYVLRGTPDPQVLADAVAALPES